MSTVNVSHIASPRKEIPLNCAPLSTPSRFLVRFADGLYLFDYTDSGACFTADRSRARVWRNKKQAEGTARLLGGEVCEIIEPAPKRFQISASQFVCCQILVELGGAQFCGVFPAIPGSEPLVVFNNSRRGSTHGILLPELSAEAVRKILQDSNEQFEAAQVQP